MFSIELSKTITDLFKSPLCRFSAEECTDYGVLLEMDLEVHEPYREDIEREPSVRERCFFLMRRASNYVNIWWCVPEDGRYPNPSEWKNTSNHDSCWRSDGVGAPLTKLYFAMCKQVNHAEAPKNLNNFLWEFNVTKVKFEGLRRETRDSGFRSYVFDGIRPV